MAMPIKTYSDYGRDAAFLMSEAPGRSSREQVMLAASATATKAGTILGRLPEGTLSAAAGAVVSGSGGTPGNGTVGSLTVDAGADVGVYQVRILNPVANAGAFEVYRPDGSVDGDGTVGVAYNGTINFTLADGSTDFSEDDRIPITVTAAAGSGQYHPLSLTALDDTQIADAILLLNAPASASAAQRVTIVARNCEAAANMLTWPTGISGPQQAVAEAQLAAKGILVRHPA